MEDGLSTARRTTKDREIVVVTGASRGIGRAVCEQAAARGKQPVLVGRDSANMRRTLEHCAALGPAHFVACDLSRPSAVTAAAAEISSWGVPHALINCAGVVEREPVADLTPQAYERQMNTNLLAPMWLTRALLPAMRQAGRGRIVNVGSISATLGTAEQSVYNASKWALVGFTKCLAEELSNSGLMTVIVHPGAVDTDMLTGSRFAPRMTASDVATTLLHYAFDAPLAHNGAVIEMFGT